MQTVYKYNLTWTDEQSLYLPLGAEILSVEFQHGFIVLYAIVNSELLSMQPWEICIAGTGHEIRGYSKADFVGTVKTHDGQLMFHVFAKEYKW